MDIWARELQSLDRRLRDRLKPAALGERSERRNLIAPAVGEFHPLQRLQPSTMALLLDGRPLVGVDGSINTYGGEYPHYVALLRAAAVPTRGQPAVMGRIHAPIGEHPAAAGGAEGDSRVRRQVLADLEAKVALEAMRTLKPGLVLMDGPLVRFDNEAKNSFNALASQALENNIILVGVIENLESQAIGHHLRDIGTLPAAWEGLYDRELLWGLLDFDDPGRAGEVLRLARPLRPAETNAPNGPGVGICRWFMRSSRDPGVIGLDLLAPQAARAAWVPDYLFTLTPEDGRGIPVWVDMVDRQVRITDEELTTYVNHYLSGEVRSKLLLEKRRLRPQF